MSKKQFNRAKGSSPHFVSYYANLSELIKACVRYFFIKFLFFHQKIALQNLWKMFFISSKKLFLFPRFSSFCSFFLSFPNIPNSKGQMEVEWFMMSWIKFAGVNFWNNSENALYYIMKLGQKNFPELVS